MEGLLFILRITFCISTADGETEPLARTRRREEGPGQLAVFGDLPDLRADVDQPPDRWRDPVEAEQSRKHSLGGVVVKMKPSCLFTFFGLNRSFACIPTLKKKNDICKI